MAIPTQDPRTQYPQPPFPKQKQTPPGDSFEVNPPPDYGEPTYQGSGKLTGRVALITGADSGIGRAVALAFAREGADILISYLNEDEDAQETERLVTRGRAARRCGVPGDITEEAHCQAARPARRAGVGPPGHPGQQRRLPDDPPGHPEMPAEEWDHTFRTNIYAMFYLCKAALPQLPPGGAHHQHRQHRGVQAGADPAGLRGDQGGHRQLHQDAVSAQAIEKGVRVNAVAPGPVWTPLIPSTMPPEQVTTFGQQTPLEAPGPAGGTRPAVRVPGVAGRQLHHRPGHGVTGGSPIV